jgi:ABC-type Fe3+/spermidine/putrescine transport system ATPase subunit
VTILVRPERLILSREAPGVGVNALPARVMQALYSGKETVYLLRLTEKLTWKACLSSGEAERERFQVGEEICIAWDPQEALVLNE